MVSFRYESDRIQENSKNGDNIIMLPYCRMKIQNIKPNDNGKWTCSVVGKNYTNQEITQIQAIFNLVVEKGLKFSFFVNFS